MSRPQWQDIMVGVTEEVHNKKEPWQLDEWGTTRNISSSKGIYFVDGYLFWLVIDPFHIENISIGVKGGLNMSEVPIRRF